MKKVEGVIQAINKASHKIQIQDGIEIEYAHRIGSEDRNEYGSIRKRYYIYGNASITFSETLPTADYERFVGAKGNANPDLILNKVFKIVMKQAYYLLIEVLSLDQYILLDLDAGGQFQIRCYHGNQDRGPFYAGSMKTSYAAGRYIDNAVPEWVSYQENRFPNRG